VEAKVSANDVCLQYLEQYLQGELKELIKGCLHLDRNSGYIEAKKLLKEKYGNRYEISNAYIKKINKWPFIWSGDELALDRLFIFLGQCRSVMSTLTFLSILNHPHNLQSMVSKLPFPLQDRWWREASKRRLARGRIPTFDDFVTFVNTEAGVATDPVFCEKPSIAWMAHRIALIIPTKAKVLGSLKLSGTVLEPRITSPIRQQM